MTDLANTPTPNLIPLLVIGGYLGAGKTTLLNHLLRQAGGRRLAVLVNDFGDISIDANLIVGAADGVLALAGGCVCCSFGSDLVGSLVTVAQREPPPDLILIECSGVGLPGAVARSAALAPGVQVQGVVVLTDASEIRRQLRDPYVGDTVATQLQQADMLVLNQAERLDAPSLAALAAWLSRHAPGVPQVVCSFGQLPAELLLDFRAAAVPDSTAEAWAGSGGRYQRPTGHAAVSDAASRFRFHTERFDGPVDLQALAARLGAPGSSLLRAKGAVQGLDGQAWLVQVVGRRVRLSPLPGPPGPSLGRLACISLCDTGSA